MKENLKIAKNAVLVIAPIGFFYQRHLPTSYLLSVDNTTWFIAYWLFVPMLIWHFVDSEASISTPVPKSPSAPRPPSSSMGGTGWKKFDKAPAQKVYHRHDVTWGAMNKPFEEYAAGDEPSSSWFLRHNIDLIEFKRFVSESNLKYGDLYFHPKLTLKKYDNWAEANAFPKSIKEINRGKPITPTHSRETIQEEVTMYDFFAHPLYKEFETREGINLKDTKLEVLQIYKLFKAYLLLNHNIEITTKDL
jgi:hypothetical protein